MPGCGPTHWNGCRCHEAEWQAKLDACMDRHALAVQKGEHAAKELEAELDDLQEKFTAVSFELAGVREALRWIADRPLVPRPDGTFNHCREALIDYARRALEHTNG